MDDLIFRPIAVPCPDCGTLVTVSTGFGNYQEEVVCPKCSFVFISNINFNVLFFLMKEVENRYSKKIKPSGKCAD